jgi:hypothetical protein
MTKLLFNIGLFPLIMIFSTLIFFSGEWHERLHHWIIRVLKIETQSKPDRFLKPVRFGQFTKFVLFFYILIQLFLPFRYLLYPNDLFWSEEGYRFSWRVMLVEKSGMATFTVADSETGRKSEIVNGDYLTFYQEKQMAIQPDFILQFAHHLAKEYEQKHGFVNPKVTVDAHVAMNGRISKRLVKSEVNLAEIDDGFGVKNWVTDY